MMTHELERAIEAVRRLRETWAGAAGGKPTSDSVLAVEADMLDEIERSAAANRFNHDLHLFSVVFAEVINKNYKEAKKILFGSRVSDQTRTLLISAINELVLADRRLEWTSHGVRPSFRFWPRKKKEKYILAANETVEDLKSLSEYTCLGFGSVLSIYRDHDLNPHDDDLDVIIAFRSEQVPTIRSGLDFVADHLADKGYMVSGDFFSHRHIRQSGFRLDVFVGLIEQGDMVGWFPGRRLNLRLEDVFPAASHDIFGIACEIPRDPETYLATVYGENWRQPIAGWQHSRDRSSYRDIW